MLPPMLLVSLLPEDSLKKSLDNTYAGNTAIEKAYDAGQDEKDRRPFKVILDFRLRASTTGSKVFAVMKRMLDGGVFIPHSTSRFPGYNESKPEEDNKVLRERVLGGHIDKYLKKLKGTEKESVQFRKWLECLKATGAKNVEGLYKKIHE